MDQLDKSLCFIIFVIGSLEDTLLLNMNTKEICTLHTNTLMGRKSMVVVFWLMWSEEEL